MIQLAEYYRTLTKKDYLVGLKVWDTNNEQSVYIKSVDEGLWCGRSLNNDTGHYYSMDRLMIDVDDEFNKGIIHGN